MLPLNSGVVTIQPRSRPPNLWFGLSYSAVRGPWYCFGAALAQLLVLSDFVLLVAVSLESPCRSFVL
jgi:hypothetical protein